MTRYFFDFRDGTEFILDGEGLLIRDMAAVQQEAAKALSGLARDSMATFNGSQGHQMSVEVRDGDGPVMKLELSFNITRDAGDT